MGLSAGIVGCGGSKDQVTLEFSSAAALQHTSVISVTAFEPILREADSDALEFVGCQDIGPFPPSRRVNPDTVALSNLLGRVLRERESQTYPLQGDWSIGLDTPDITNESNPWGAMLVYIEARGDARASDRGAGQVAATLLAGCYCVRTRDEGFSDPALTDLDKVIRKECPLLGAEEGGGERVVPLQAVVPPEFKLVIALDGNERLSTPKNAVISPGPRVELDATRCDNVVTPRDCYKCKSQVCDEFDADRSNAPVLFQVEQPGGSSGPSSQIVLTDSLGNASANIEVDDCSAPLAVTAQLLGRPEETLRFEVSCVSPVTGFTCTQEQSLAPDFEAIDVTTIPGEPGRCTTARPELCDQVAVIYENAEAARLEVFHPNGGPPVSIEYANSRAHSLKGFSYEVGTGLQPALAVVLSKPNIGAQIYVYAWQDGQLVPTDGAEGKLVGPCPWVQESCTNESPCWPQLQPQARIGIEVRDVDGDGAADLAFANNGEYPMVFLYSGQAQNGAMYTDRGCECLQFGKAPNAFVLANMGGSIPNPSISDVVLGSSGGYHIRYATPLAGGPRLTCGQAASLTNTTMVVNVRDVLGAKLTCRTNDPGCSAYDDVVIISARGISGGSLDEPGTIQVLSGTSMDLTTVSGGNLDRIPGLNLSLTPRTFAERTEPRDPRTASITDFNGDNHQDLAVLYKASEEVHVWLGASNRGLGEIENGVILEDCEASLNPNSRCAPLQDFATPDLDGDGRAEIVVVCDPMSTQPRIRFFKAQAN